MLGYEEGDIDLGSGVVVVQYRRMNIL